MNHLRKIRKKLGMTQKETAVYLQVSMSMVSMVERQQRKLPTAALLRLSQLEEKGATDKNPTISQKENEEAQRYCQKEKNWCELKKARLEKELEQMHRRYLHYQKILAQSKDTLGDDPILQKIQQSQRSHWQQQLKKRNLKNQVKLRLQISSLSARVKQAEQFLEEWKGKTL